MGRAIWAQMSQIGVSQIEAPIGSVFQKYVYSSLMVKMRIIFGSFGLFWFILGWGCARKEFGKFEFLGFPIMQLNEALESVMNDQHHTDCAVMDSGSRYRPQQLPLTPVEKSQHVIMSHSSVS